MKAGLSAYLREVRAGATILVQDREECIAEIQRPAHAMQNPVLQALAANGELVLPARKKPRLGASPLRVSEDLAQSLLDAGRAE